MRNAATHRTYRGRTRWQRATRGEGGYLIVLTALALLPLVVFVSFSVDVGAWYARASKLQRAADASALAAAVWMPDIVKATTVAGETASRNGIVNSGDITLTVSPVAGDSHKVAVSIRDAKAPQFFSKLLMGPVAITRKATARYEQSIPMGSPHNYFGTGSLNGGATSENLWAAVSGYCSAKENGDLRLAAWDNTFGGGNHECAVGNGAFANPDYSPTGYIFEVKMPAANLPATVAVQVYDAGFNSGSVPNPDSTFSGGAVITTTYNLYGAGNNVNPLANPLLTTNTIGSGNGAWAGWNTVGTIVAPCASCVYYLQVFTQANQASSWGSNGFALRAVQNGTWSPCSTIVGSAAPPYSNGCVQVYPREEMSVFANLSGTTATFYLASIDAAYAGRTLSIQLFDPGEGATRIEILDPNGNVVNFNWTTPCTNPPAPATGGCTGTNVNRLNPGVNNANRPYPRLSSRWVYNDRRLTLTLTLPADYATQFGTSTWWRIRYQVGTSATDRTTWSVGVAGAPVRLVE